MAVTPASGVVEDGNAGKPWKTSPDYCKSNLQISLGKFTEVMDLLIQRPNLNSPHLFRADILFDSASRLQIVNESGGDESNKILPLVVEHSRPIHVAPSFPGYRLERTVVRRLIPRNPHLDRALSQTCYMFSGTEESADDSVKRLVVYVPHTEPEQDMPWYHPTVSALAYYFKACTTGSVLCAYYKPIEIDGEAAEKRLHRTFLSLIQTVIRLAKIDSPPELVLIDAVQPAASRVLSPSALKDTIIPQHVVQNAYTRLKQKYAVDLIQRWVESTEPSKHVFEDLSIAAFLIELWKQMYKPPDAFPGFVDLACGNGVLTYILIQEGYNGYGFDARRRKTWDILGIDQHLQERLCIPKPFLDLQIAPEIPSGPNIHDGIFPAGTFLVSNHADELVPWTPVFAALASPTAPLPFLAIPCCSHDLSGARRRFSLKDVQTQSTDASNQDGALANEDTDNKIEPDQSAKGDLRALRTQKQRAATHIDDKSQYACLTKKVVALAEELDITIDLTLMRIPSTRNIGIVGNRGRPNLGANVQSDPGPGSGDTAETTMAEEKIARLLERECLKSGGIHGAARAWIERAKKLTEPGQRGKVNLGGNISGSKSSIGSNIQ